MHISIHISISCSFFSTAVESALIWNLRVSSSPWQRENFNFQNRGGSSYFGKLSSTFSQRNVGIFENKSTPLHDARISLRNTSLDQSEEEALHFKMRPSRFSLVLLSFTKVSTIFCHCVCTVIAVCYLIFGRVQIRRRRRRKMELIRKEKTQNIHSRRIVE